MKCLLCNVLATESYRAQNLEVMYRMRDAPNDSSLYSLPRFRARIIVAHIRYILYTCTLSIRKRFCRAQVASAARRISLRTVAPSVCVQSSRDSRRWRLWCFACCVRFASRNPPNYSVVFITKVINKPHILGYTKLYCQKAISRNYIYTQTLYAYTKMCV